MVMVPQDIVVEYLVVHSLLGRKHWATEECNVVVSAENGVVMVLVEEVHYLDNPEVHYSYTSLIVVCILARYIGGGFGKDICDQS